jgi:hypothetical protein
MTAKRYAVVSCHVERPLDDRVWAAFRRFQERRPGGFRVAALMRPPDRAAGESEALWLERAREAAARAPLGHHTHWGGETQARPVGGDPADRVRREGEWLRAESVEARFFCGGGWYMDAGVAAAVADLGYVDTTATAYRQSYLAADAPRVELPGPARLRLADGRRLLELPATHSLGMLVRGVLRPLPPIVHVHFHDWDLVDRRRAAALELSLRLLRLRRRPLDLVEAAEAAAATAPEVPFGQVATVESALRERQAPLAGHADG